MQLSAVGDDLQLLPALPIAEPYRVRRLLAEPFDVVRMHPHALHRGVCDEEDYVRRVFFIASTNHPDFALEEEYLAPIIVDDGS